MQVCLPGLRNRLTSSERTIPRRKPATGTCFSRPFLWRRHALANLLMNMNLCSHCVGTFLITYINTTLFPFRLITRAHTSSGSTEGLIFLHVSWKRVWVHMHLHATCIFSQASHPNTECCPLGLPNYISNCLRYFIKEWHA